PRSTSVARSRCAPLLGSARRSAISPRGIARAPSASNSMIPRQRSAGTWAILGCEQLSVIEDERQGKRSGCRYRLTRRNLCWREESQERVDLTRVHVATGDITTAIAERVLDDRRSCVGIGYVDDPGVRIRRP